MVSIGIVGAGVVGMATGLGFQENGHKVIFYDISQEKIDLLHLKNLSVAKNVKELFKQSEIIFVCVNTPTINGEQNLDQINSSILPCAKAIDNTSKYHLLVFRSTLLPGTMEKITDFLEHICQKTKGQHYDICYNPEFLTEKSPLTDFKNPDRVVIGEDRKNSSIPLQEIYQGFTKNIILTNFQTAEMIKYVSNCFLSLKISFFNQMGLTCNFLGIDDKVVSQAVSLDKRIGKYGTIFGKPFGGSCLPKDTEAFVSFLEKNKSQPGILKTVLEINKNMEQMNQKLIE